MASSTEILSLGLQLGIGASVGFWLSTAAFTFCFSIVGIYVKHWYEHKYEKTN